MQPKGGWDRNILAFDTSLPHVSAAVYRDDWTLAEQTEAMERGQAERLIPLIEGLLAQVDGRWADLDALAVGIGPGNFTGVRISVAAARGLALGLGIPAVGVSLFEALLDWDQLLNAPALILSLEAPRGQAYVQHFRYGKPQSPPRLIDPEAPPADIELPINMNVRGYMAKAIAKPFGVHWEDAMPTRVAARLARIADLRLHEPDFDPSMRPAPLYVRGPDAAPPRDPAPIILPG